MAVLVDRRVDEMTGSMITDSIIRKYAMIPDSITGKDVTNTGSSTKSDNHGAKGGQGDTSVITAAVLPSRQRLPTIYVLQLKN